MLIRPLLLLLPLAVAVAAGGNDWPFTPPPKKKPPTEENGRRRLDSGPTAEDDGASEHQGHGSSCFCSGQDKFLCFKQHCLLGILETYDASSIQNCLLLQYRTYLDEVGPIKCDAEGRFLVTPEPDIVEVEVKGESKNESGSEAHLRGRVLLSSVEQVTKAKFAPSLNHLCARELRSPDLTYSGGIFLEYNCFDATCVCKGGNAGDRNCIQKICELEPELEQTDQDDPLEPARGDPKCANSAPFICQNGAECTSWTDGCNVCFTCCGCGVDGTDIDVCTEKSCPCLEDGSCPNPRCFDNDQCIPTPDAFPLASQVPATFVSTTESPTTREGCEAAAFDIIDAGPPDKYRGWYDPENCGLCNQYCRWVGSAGSGGDPSSVLTRAEGMDLSYWSCQTGTMSDEDVYHEYDGSSFAFTKCSAKNADPNDGRCVDLIVGWHDNDGQDFDCNWYGENPIYRCAASGFKTNSQFGKPAMEACCSCLDETIQVQILEEKEQIENDLQWLQDTFGHGSGYDDYGPGYYRPDPYK